MPLYTVICDDCEAKSQLFRRVADRDSLPSCDKCNGVLRRTIDAPFVAVDLQPYVSPATGKVINSRAQQKYDLEKSGHILMEPGLKKDIARNREYEAERRFKPIEAAVDAAVNNAVVSGQLESL
jgi:putative FmdB family regulatory protein